MSLSLSGPLIGHSDRPLIGWSLCGPAGLSHSAPGCCDAAISSVQREKGERIAICINCKMSSSGGDRL